MVATGGTTMDVTATRDGGQEAAARRFFAPDRPVSLPDQLYEQLMAQIAGGALPVGARLPSEPMLARAFGVSRPVVRTALARLRADGLIASRQGAGSFVLRRPRPDFMAQAPLGSAAELLRCFEFRLAVESEAAALAATRRGSEDLAAIERAAGAMAQVFARGEIGADADIAFHRAVAAASQNEMFVRALDMARGPMRDGIATARRLSRALAAERRALVLAEHAAILAAIRERAPETARAAMRAHIDRSRDGMLGLQG